MLSWRRDEEPDVVSMEATYWAGISIPLSVMYAVFPSGVMAMNAGSNNSEGIANSPITV